MKLFIDPMPALRAAKIAKVNDAFNIIAASNFQRDQAHAMKRAWAANYSNKLADEAKLRGITLTELCDLIQDKPDLAAERELKRQRIMIAIDNAKSPDELNAIDGNS